MYSFQDFETYDEKHNEKHTSSLTESSERKRINREATGNVAAVRCESRSAVPHRLIQSPRIQ